MVDFFLSVHFGQSAPIGSDHDGDVRQRDFLYFPFDINPFLLHISNSLVVKFSVDEIELDFGFVVEIP